MWVWKFQWVTPNKYAPEGGFAHIFSPVAGNGGETENCTKTVQLKTLLREKIYERNKV